MKRTAILAVLLAPSLAVAGPDFGGTPAPSRAPPEAASAGTSDVLPIDDVTFALDSAGLLPAGQAQVKTAARWLVKHPHTKVVLEGHADTSGPGYYNDDLATRRLQIVRDHLRAYGVNTDRIVLVVYGEVGAQPSPNPNDRRVVLFASVGSIYDIANASLDEKHARAVIWTDDGALHIETRGTRVAARGAKP